MSGLWKCVVSAAAADGDDDGDAAVHPCHCRGDDDDGPNRSLAAETASHQSRGGGERAARTVMAFPV